MSTQTATRRSVADVMERNVVTFSPETSLGEAARTFADRQFSGAPVCSHDGRVIGVVSTTDLAESCGPLKNAPCVGEIMSPDVLSVRADEPLQHAIDAMAFEGVHRVVVVDETGRPIGIVTSMDVLRELAGFSRHEARVVAVAPPDDR